MNTIAYRANALSVFALLILAVTCFMASLSDNLNVPTPTAEVRVLDVNWFRKLPSGNDEVFVFLAAEYETRQNSLNQVSLWDAIIPSEDYSHFQVQTNNKYPFVDQGSNLRGRIFNLTLHWHVMPKTGKMSEDKIVMTGYRLPKEYKYNNDKA
ncbi:hypothetical protein Sjap_007789 [Stephania japonica]|uniref:Signal peptidase complex subunit 3 n=1 Tax=Stephania japonica TaxID=461633 RepID=A0AAP0JP47_9MAGN